MAADYKNNLELIELSQTGDKSATERLVENNMGLVRSIAARFAGRGVEYEDLAQIGTIGIIKAIRSFDKSFGTAFSTYAVPMIIGEIKRFLRDDSMIRVSRDTKRRGIEIMHAIEDFSHRNGREPHTDELSAITGFTPEEIVYSLDAISPVHSLQESSPSSGKSRDGGNEQTLEDFIPGGEDEIEAATNRIALKEALDNLPEMQRNIINLRYFKNLSQDQTARVLGLTQVKISREEKRIFKKLREVL
ncbi:RNA polymerase sigma factor [Clostridia bacterium]|nr:RNA polymerase sigma factor [Clostridia bacterium]GHV13543.1 RNA polymerase sigma factor [Clostridia bacterium]